jgi:dTDP-4-amino-4,6-dideoxygalactose transaminase
MSFDKIIEFERALADYTGAPYAVMTDCCTHAIELCLRYERTAQTIDHVAFTAYTYLSIPMTMHKLSINYNLLEEQWMGEYQFHGTRIWDSARRLERGMYRSKQMQCLSFGHTKPLQIGHGGAILLDDQTAYDALLRMRYDGRNLTVSPWQTQQTFAVGYHYRPTIEDAQRGLDLLNHVNEAPKYVAYPDLRHIKIVE